MLGNVSGTWHGEFRLKSAIILAAGIGSRLSPVTDNIPKCCVKVKNKTIIKRITDQLLSCDQDMKINIVAGHLSYKVREEMGNYPDNVNIVENPEYQTTNNMESCRMGLAENDIMKGDLLIINGDCVYSDRIVKMLHGAKCSTIGIDSSGYNEESMKILSHGGRVVSMSKEILESQGGLTSIDFYSFINRDVIALNLIMKEFFQNQNRNEWTEVAIDALLKMPDSNIKALDVSGEKWIEIDNHNDLKSARNLW